MICGIEMDAKLSFKLQNSDKIYKNKTQLRKQTTVKHLKSIMTWYKKNNNHKKKKQTGPKIT